MLDKDLIDRLKKLDPNEEEQNKKRDEDYKRLSPEDRENVEEAMKLVEESYSEIFQFIELQLEKGYGDITAFAMFQVLLKLLREMKKGDADFVARFIDKFQEGLDRI